MNRFTMDFEGMTDEEIDEYYRPLKSNSRKSLAPLFVYLILGKDGTEKSPLSQKDILDRLWLCFELSLERKALSRILHLLPQATKQFIPAYKGILVSLVQGTAIVGYIAVEDLTRMSDIIRGRTYEAFFPIIASALIYLILCRLLTLLIRIVQIRVDPQARSAERVLKRFSK